MIVQGHIATEYLLHGLHTSVTAELWSFLAILSNKTSRKGIYNPNLFISVKTKTLNWNTFLFQILD